MSRKRNDPESFQKKKKKKERKKKNKENTRMPTKGGKNHTGIRLFFTEINAGR